MIPKRILETEEWEEYQRLKEENKQLERTIKYLSECINEKDGLLYNYMRENKQLKDNWNKLKEWLEENESFDDYCNETTFTYVLEKMQELEKGDK